MITRMRWLSPLLVGVVVAIGCGSGKSQSAAAKTEGVSSQQTGAPQAPSGAAPAKGGTAVIQSAIRLSGAAPAPAPVKMSADPVCQQQHANPITSEEVVVDDQGGLKNVLVYVKEGLSGAFPAPTSPVTLNQTGCWYQPHVMGIQVNQPLEIVNGDATLHNVNAKPSANQPFNVAQPVKGMKTTKKFTTPEIAVKFKCNVHPWMSAYAGVVNHPFFGVSDEHGAVSLFGLPAGAYVLEAWHEKYGTQTQSVTVADGETTSIEWTFQAQ